MFVNAHCQPESSLIGLAVFGTASNWPASQPSAWPRSRFHRGPSPRRTPRRARAGYLAQDGVAHSVRTGRASGARRALGAVRAAGAGRPAGAPRSPAAVGAVRAGRSAGAGRSTPSPSLAAGRPDWRVDDAQPSGGIAVREARVVTGVDHTVRVGDWRPGRPSRWRTPTRRLRQRATNARRGPRIEAGSLLSCSDQMIGSRCSGGLPIRPLPVEFRAGAPERLPR